MNSMAMSLAAFIRSGSKSRASILVDTSMARTMSIPSVSTLSDCDEERGRAMHTTMRHIAARRRSSGRWRSTARGVLPPLCHCFPEATFRLVRLPVSSRNR